jgi:hypothetical protein
LCIAGCVGYSFNSAFVGCRFGISKATLSRHKPQGEFENMIRKYTISALLAAACLATSVNSVSGDEPKEKTPAKLTSAVQADGYCPPAYKSELAGNGGIGYSGYNYPKAIGQSAGTANSRDCNRFYHYPYVFYPQNFQPSEYYRSSDSMYYRYPAEMQIPVYNRNWYNEYPSSKRFHSGHHFILDVF